MTRTADPARREELLEAILAYVEDHGVSALSLRPLGAAVGASPRTLLYHFGSKEAMLSEVMRARRASQRGSFMGVFAGSADPVTDACRRIWALMSTAEGLAAFKRSLETLTFALRAPHKYEGFLESSIHDWLDFRDAQRRAQGYTPADSQAIGTLIIAGFRGFLLDLCATGDRRRVDRAVDLWIDSLDSLPSASELSHAPASV